MLNRKIVKGDMMKYNDSVITILSYSEKCDEYTVYEDLINNSNNAGRRIKKGNLIRNYYSLLN